MDGWTFFDFLNARGENEILTWLNSSEVPKEAKAKINARIITLQGFPIFPEQYFSAYTGWDDIYELRVVYGNVQYRPFGFYGPSRKQFCLVVGGLEKGKVPKSLLKIAEARRKIVIANPSQTCRHDFS
jgi:hypothetical protein